MRVGGLGEDGKGGRGKRSWKECYYEDDSRRGSIYSGTSTIQITSI